MSMNDTNTKRRSGKATHKGTCQVCGCSQKLPNGAMSLHGYTVQFGWFSGTCHGAKNLPLEQSCDLIQASIDRTKLAIVDVENKKAEVENSTGIFYYKRYATGQTVHCEATINKTDSDNWTVTVEQEDPYTYARNPPMRKYSKGVTDWDEDESRKDCAIALSIRIRNMNEYIARQTATIENWEPKPLTKI
jgi:hypothetical protein